MGRLYSGAYRVGYRYFDDSGKVQSDITDPATYEECEILCMLVGAGLLQIKDRTPISAIIVGPFYWGQKETIS